VAPLPAVAVTARLRATWRPPMQSAGPPMGAEDNDGRVLARGVPGGAGCVLVVGALVGLGVDADVWAGSMSVSIPVAMCFADGVGRGAARGASAALARCRPVAGRVVWDGTATSCEAAWVGLAGQHDCPAGLDKLGSSVVLAVGSARSWLAPYLVPVGDAVGLCEGGQASPGWTVSVARPVGEGCGGRFVRLLRG